jgi:hypothetical protein
MSADHTTITTNLCIKTNTAKLPFKTFLFVATKGKHKNHPT